MLITITICIVISTILLSYILATLHTITKCNILATTHLLAINKRLKIDNFEDDPEYVAYLDKYFKAMKLLP